MDQVLNSADVENQGSQSPRHPSNAPSTGKRTEQIEQVRHDIQQRATVMGPVLEEILQSHWEHWGLND
jgi:hypothetical protein